MILIQHNILQLLTKEKFWYSTFLLKEIDPSVVLNYFCFLTKVFIKKNILIVYK